MSLLHPLYFSLFPQGDTITSRAHGLDISKYDLFFTPETASAQLDFVIQRISYRLTRDEAFERLLPGVMSVGIRGGYHYLNSDKPWREQADAYLSFVSGLDYHFHACDFEDSYNTLSLDFAYRSWYWIQYVANKTGKPTFLYTSPSLYNEYISPSGVRYGLNWNSVPLWTAQWFWTPNPNGTPSNPSGRTAGWKLWQYTANGNGPLYGVARPTACDLNVWNGTAQEMRDFLNIGEPVPPIPEEPTVNYYAIQSNTTRSRSIRSGPGVKNPKLIENGDLFPGDIAKAGATAADVYIYGADVPDSSIEGGYSARRGDTWRKVFENDGRSVAGWIAKIHLAQVMISEVFVQVTEPPTLKHVIKVYSDGSYSVDDGPVIA